MYFFLKLYGSASMHAPGRETGIPIIEPEEIRAAVRVAQNYNTYVAIHCHGARAIDNAVRAGVHTVEHASNEETQIRLGKIKDRVIASLKNAYQHNILIGWGTDVIRDYYVDRPDTEFRLCKEWLEYSDEDIIKQATVNSARLMYMDDRIGTIKAGKDADVILVKGDPSRDIRVMYQKPLHVIKGGKLVR